MKHLAIPPNCSTINSLELNNSSIKLHASNRLVSLPINKIVRLEGDCNYTVIHTQNNIYISSRTLKHFEGILDKNTFVRVHKSHLINMQFVREVQPNNNEIKFAEGKPIEVSRRKLKEVIRKFETYNKV